MASKILVLSFRSMGTNASAEPSLMMPGITISFIFSEQGRLFFRAFPS
jgi:hypothetical protein